MAFGEYFIGFQTTHSQHLRPMNIMLCSVKISHLVFNHRVGLHSSYIQQVCTLNVCIYFLTLLSSLQMHSVHTFLLSSAEVCWVGDTVHRLAMEYADIVPLMDER